MPSTPSPGELEILLVLWNRGASTVKEVWEALGGKTGYTSVLKLMQLMAEKEFVTRDVSQRSHVYSANLPQEETERTLVAGLRDRAFGGSAAKLVLRALDDQELPATELEKIRRLIESIEQKREESS
jgi:predicted transcriptional regulator